MKPSRTLVTVELRFVADEAAQGLVDRIEEAVASIVGRTALEEFRSRSLPLDGPPPNLSPFPREV